ncbi:uncharacterized protein BO95DRAFT_463725 [Aspergillus brunneoviolaceus CBS 621.78]|uniref:Uncharacterized protein n=1 Tax=Aspergillus brunneoviolaceus CBS 621.78 TaxID=1450534 RepID=A0ACD1G8X8_9EURO|nr:hypothetical protein BO95DRAFT_463725 [Aspergillus brunneoviolaceus CBS 621.78]RAH45699.1 hypothetical protein BO95DRAFT_463725 [Aspergillus brunneoviolaceus CBS 621.78]
MPSYMYFFLVTLVFLAGKLAAAPVPTMDAGMIAALGDDLDDAYHTITPHKRGDDADDAYHTITPHKRGDDADDAYHTITPHDH